jgi:hypothetical protein
MPFRIVWDSNFREGITDEDGRAKVSVPTGLKRARVCLIWRWYSETLLPEGMTLDAHRLHLQDILRGCFIDVDRMVDFTATLRPEVEFIGMPAISVNGHVVDHEGNPVAAMVHGGTCGNFVSAGRKTKSFQLSGVPKDQSSELLVVAINTTTDQLGFWHAISKDDATAEIDDLVIRAPRYQPDSNLYFEAHSNTTSKYSHRGLGYGVTLIQEDGQIMVSYHLRPQGEMFKARLDPLPMQAGTYYVIPGLLSKNIEFMDFMACVRAGADLEQVGIPKIACTPGEDARIVLDIERTHQAMIALGDCAANGDAGTDNDGGQNED